MSDVENDVPHDDACVIEGHAKIARRHLDRRAYVYVRQSSPQQVENNRESRRRQYGRIDWALAAGWNRDQITVIDDDQGVTGSLPRSRPGFEQMANAVGSGEVGIVISIEGARLARNGPDWAELLFVCRWTGTLIADEHGIYDMASAPDRMVLGIRGQINQLELDTSIHRMQAARLNKARRGGMMTIPPAGYDLDELGHIVAAADEAVVDAICNVFAKFDELGSVRQVWCWWRDEGLRYPVRCRRRRTHPIEWVRPTYRRILTTLHDPTYAGKYVYGRTETVRELDPADQRKLVIRTRLRAKPAVEIPDHHFAYVPWDRFAAIQDRIRNNQQMKPGDGHSPGPVREGRGLLQGLVRCGHCGRRLWMASGGSAVGAKGRTPQYQCRGDTEVKTGRRCQVTGTQRIDDAVVAAFLDVAEPSVVEAVVRAEELAREQVAAADRTWQLQIEKAEYEAERAARQFHATEPENRLVVRSLERRWNERLQVLEQVRSKAAKARRELPTLAARERQRLEAALSDIATIWSAQTTTSRDHKSLLRCLIEEVQLRSEDNHNKIRIVWKGGAITDLELVRRRNGQTGNETSEATVDLVRKLAVELDDVQIALILNKQRRRTGVGNTFTKSRVSSLRHTHRIPRCRQVLVRDPREGPFTADEAADELGVTSASIHRWLRDGTLAGRQLAPGAPWRIRLTEELRQRLQVGDAPSHWVGLSEAARRLGLSKSRVAHMVKTGKLPAMRTIVRNRECWRIDVTTATCAPQTGLFDQK